MKKMNRKGFTLIELLVVIVILLVIMSIAIPSVTSSIERSKEKQKQRQIELAISAGELYFDSHKNSADPTDGVFVSTLISNKLLVGIEQSDICERNECCILYNTIDKKYNFLDGYYSQSCQQAH